MTTFVDTNVLIYLFDPSRPEHAWSVAEFNKCKQAGPVILSDIVYSEFSAGFGTKLEVDEVVQTLGLERMPMSDDALFAAGQLFKKYKLNGGTRSNVLSDFLIAAQVESMGASLLTGNTRDFRKLFPAMALITPP